MENVNSKQVRESNEAYATLFNFIAGRRLADASMRQIRTPKIGATLMISEWMTHLPADCIDASVRLGWMGSRESVA